LAPAHDPAVIASVNVIVGAGSQLSTAVALPPVAAGSLESLQLIVIFTGIVRTGEVMSCILIVWGVFLIFPHASTAFQVRIIRELPLQIPGVVTSE
jgi:hypothetical protein